MTVTRIAKTISIALPIHVLAILSMMLYRMIFLVLAISYTAVLLPVKGACFVGTACVHDPAGMNASFIVVIGTPFV